MSAVELIARIVGAVVALAVVLLAAWLLLRWLGGRMPGLSGGSGRHIQVLDRLSVGRGSTVLLLRVEKQVLLVALTDHAVQKLAEFEDDGSFDAKQNPAEMVRFSDALKDAARHLKNKGGKGEEE